MAKFTVILSDEMNGVVTALAQRRDMPKTQVLRRAIALMKYLDDAVVQGDKVIIRSAEGRERQVVFESQV